MNHSLKYFIHCIIKKSVLFFYGDKSQSLTILKHFDLIHEEEKEDSASLTFICYFLFREIKVAGYTDINKDRENIQVLL